MVVDKNRLAEAKIAIQNNDIKWLQLLIGFNKKQAQSEENAPYIEIFFSYITTSILYGALDAYMEDLQEGSATTHNMGTVSSHFNTHYLIPAIRIATNDISFWNKILSISTKSKEQLLAEYTDYVNQVFTNSLTSLLENKDKISLFTQLDKFKKINDDKNSGIGKFDSKVATTQTSHKHLWEKFLDELDNAKTYYPKPYSNHEQRNQLIQALSTTAPIPVQNMLDDYCLVSLALSKFSSLFNTPSNFGVGSSRNHVDQQTLITSIDKSIAIVKTLLFSPGIDISRVFSSSSIVISLGYNCLEVLKLTTTHNFDTNLTALQNLLKVFQDYFAGLAPEISSALVLRRADTAIVTINSESTSLTYSQTRKEADLLQKEIDAFKQEVLPDNTFFAILKSIYYFFHGEEKIRDLKSITAAEVINTLFEYTGDKTLCAQAISRVQNALTVKDKPNSLLTSIAVNMNFSEQTSPSSVSGTINYGAAESLFASSQFTSPAASSSKQNNNLRKNRSSSSASPHPNETTGLLAGAKGKQKEREDDELSSAEEQKQTPNELLSPEEQMLEKFDAMLRAFIS